MDNEALRGLGHAGVPRGTSKWNKLKGNEVRRERPSGITGGARRFWEKYYLPRISLTYPSASARRSAGTPPCAICGFPPPFPPYFSAIAFMMAPALNCLRSEERRVGK